MANDEKKLIESIRDGETKNFGQLIAQYGPALMAFVGRIVTRQEDAEDVVQESFVNAYEHLTDFNPAKASLKTWLYRLAYHEALRHLRRQKREVLLPFEVSDDMPDDLPDTTTAEQLDKAILLLPSEDQMLLQLYYFDQRPLKEIAYITATADSPPERESSRLSSQLYRIRQRLRIILTRMNDE